MILLISLKNFDDKQNIKKFKNYIVYKKITSNKTKHAFLENKLKNYRHLTQVLLSVNLL